MYKMFSLVVLWFVVCGVSGDGEEFARPDGLQFFFSYADKNPAGRPAFSYQSQDGQTSKSSSNIITAANGGDLGNLGNLIYTRPQVNPFLEHVFNNFQEQKAADTSQPQSSPKCSVENNIRISNPSETNEEVTEIFERLLKKNSEFILRQTSTLLSRNLEKHLKTLEHLVEYKTRQVITDAINELLLRLEAGLDDGVSSTVTTVSPTDENIVTSTEPSLFPAETNTLTTEMEYAMESTTAFTTETTEVLITDFIQMLTNTISPDSWPEKKSKLILEENSDDGSTDFIRTPQQIPPRHPIHHPVFFGVNRPSSINHSPHGLKRRPKPVEGVRPHKS